MLYLLLWHSSNALIASVLVQDRAAPPLPFLATSQAHCPSLKCLGDRPTAAEHPANR